MSFANFLRFWPLAASRNSSRAPVDRLSLVRSSGAKPESTRIKSSVGGRDGIDLIVTRTIEETAKFLYEGLIPFRSLFAFSRDVVAL
jgi:hypothetical protein